MASFENSFAPFARKEAKLSLPQKVGVFRFIAEINYHEKKTMIQVGRLLTSISKFVDDFDI